jgi:aminoglycoside phosphotransferase (APT) family kinase protein
VGRRIIMQGRVIVINEAYAAKLLKDSLSIPGNVTAEKLGGGFSGTQLFVATADSKKYVVRFLVNKSLEERNQEIAILHVASQAGYGPHIYFADSDQAAVIMEFLTPQPISPELWQSDVLYKLLAQFLQKIHRGPKFEHTQDRNVFTTIHTLVQNLQSKSSNAIPLAKIEALTQCIHKVLAPHLTLVPCHNDLHPRNLIFLGDRFKAVDFENASQADPYFDIAMVAVFYCEKPSYEHILLSTYLGREPSQTEVAKLYLMKQVAWMYAALCFLTMVPEQLPHYEGVLAPSYLDFMTEASAGKFNLDTPEHKLIFAKVMINHAFMNSETQEFSDAANLMAENKVEEKI